MDLALVLPPLTQLNTPYPSISYLAAHLGETGIPCTQRDLGIELVLQLFSRDGLAEIFADLEEREELPEPAWRAIALRDQHLQVVEPVLAFLRGKDSGLAPRILETPFLPTGPRLAAANLEAFGPMGAADAARHLATLYIQDLADLVTSCVDEGFGLARYQAHLATGTVSFDPIWRRLNESTLVDRYLDRLTDTIQADVVGLSVPFPGNLYGALRIGKRLRERGVTVLLGGGYVNTELRDVEEPRLWSLVDAVTYDDGEGPLVALLEHLGGGPDRRHRTRTADGMHNAVVPRSKASCAADYGDLNLKNYLQTIDTLNPAHRLWADGRWNKITVAHGCYWKRCTFCDVSLDYIGRFETADVTNLVDHMERLIEDTGQRGFHFVDEAAPPAALKALAIEILSRGLVVTLWGNIRFEKAFTPDLCRLLAAAGLVAVTGGLEVANERLLGLIDKGVTVEQVARAANAFRRAGVMVHAYLMYGFPTQTVQESIDSMELVRQLFEADLVNSAFWHRFVLTRHAPIHDDPQRFGINIRAEPDNVFARNDLEHDDPDGADHDLFDEVLPVALEGWLQGNQIDRPVHEWFPTPMPATTEPFDRIADAVEDETDSQSLEGKRFIWIGGRALHGEDGLLLNTPDHEISVPGTDPELAWLADFLERATLGSETAPNRESSGASLPTADEPALDFPGDWSDFEPRWNTVRALGLLLV